MEDVDGSVRFRKEAEESLASETEMLRRTGQALLLLQTILPSGVQQWRNVIENHFDAGSLVVPDIMMNGMGEELFWLYFRLGKFLLQIELHPNTSDSPLLSHRPCIFTNDIQVTSNSVSLIPSS